MSQDFESVRSLPHVFKGGLAFNQRTVANATATLLNETDTGDSLAAKPLGIPELTNVLLLLESLAMSNEMFLDGTLPPNDVSRLREGLRKVSTQSGVAFEMEFVSPFAKELPPMFQEAAEAASLLIDRDLDQLDAQRDEPMSGDISKFVAALRISTEDNSGKLAAEFATKTSADVAEGRESFRGSKCVAGLLLSGIDPVPVAARAYERLSASTEEGQRRIVSLLINRFRINYVNSLAGIKDAAYLADTSIEDLKAAQVLLFSRYLASKIAATKVDELSQETRAVFDQHLSTVPLGLAILLNCQAQSPLGLLDEAMSVRDRRFSRAAARQSPQRRFVHSFDEAEFEAFQDYLFRETWADLFNADERRNYASSELREVKIPSAAGAVVGAVIGAIIGGAAGVDATVLATTIVSGTGAAIGEVAGSLAEHLGEQLSKGQLGNRRVNVDQYRRMSGYLTRAARNDRFNVPFRNKVESLFGRALVIT